MKMFAERIVNVLNLFIRELEGILDAEIIPKLAVAEPEFFRCRSGGEQWRDRRQICCKQHHRGPPPRWYIVDRSGCRAEVMSR
jgi:hypothetical protein